MILKRTFALAIFAAMISTGSSAFSMLRIYPGNAATGTLKTPSTPKILNPAQISRQDGRRMDIVPEVVPLQLNEGIPVKRESLIKKIGLASTVTYVKSGESVKKIYSKKDEKLNFINAVEALPKSKLQLTKVTSAGTLEHAKADKNEKSNVVETGNTSVESEVFTSTLPPATKTQVIPINSFGSDSTDKETLTTKTSNKRTEIDLKKESTESVKLQNSPIFYIRLPPSPYNFVPGFGYVSTPGLDRNVLPVDFSSNGKPSGLYYFKRPVENFVSSSTSTTTEGETMDNSAIQTTLPADLTDATESPSTTTQKPSKQVLTNSRITYIKGNFPFNGRPNGVFAVHSPYRPNYFQILHDFFYPDRKKPVHKI